jgi:hypothetical protein
MHYRHKNICRYILKKIFLVSGEVVKRQLVPTFIHQRSNNLTIHRGETAVLRCQIRNLGPKSVRICLFYVAVRQKIKV